MIGFLLDKLRERADRSLPRHLRDARRGEELAYRHLKKMGYRIVARNYRARNSRGEIDLLGWDGEQLASIEVRTKKNADYGWPEESITRKKRRLLVRATREYARRAAVDPARLRYDIVAITLQPEPELRLFKDAFDERSQWPERRFV